MATSSKRSASPFSTDPPSTDAPAGESSLPPPAKKARKGKAKEPVVYPARNTTSMIRIGAHVSAAGGVHFAAENASKIGARAFALFLKNQKQWSSKPFASNIPEKIWPDAMTAHAYDAGRDVLPHGSYLVNLGSPHEEARSKSWTCWLDDLQRAEALGIGLYNFHPGSALKGGDRDAAVAHIADAINRAHKETSTVVIVLENMAGQGDVIGSKIEDLRDIIALVENKDRVGCCIDTCHLFASSTTTDLRTPAAVHATLSNLFALVPPRFVKALHVNDSAFDLGEKKDRHQNLGMGYIGLQGFWAMLVWDGAGVEGWRGWDDIIWILETPSDGVDKIWEREIQILYDLEVLEDASRIPEIQADWKTELLALRATSKTAIKDAKVAATKKAKREEDGGEDMDEDEEEDVKPKKKKAVAKPKKAATGKGKGKGKKAKKEESDEDEGSE